MPSLCGRARLTTWLAITLAASLVALAACSSSSPGTSADRPDPSSVVSTSSSAPPLSTKYPNSVVVLGHSGTTGANSDPNDQGSDHRENSWATGDNPAVDSIYSRLLALNPAVRGHNSNFGVDGSTVNDLESQVTQALAVKPLPDLYLIQEVDNDMQCDGSDPENYPKFGATLTGILQEIVTAAPKATILLVSSPPGTVQNYGDIVRHDPKGVVANSGSGQCDLFDLDGKAVPAHWRNVERITAGYDAQLAAVCKRFTQCRYDGGALYRMPITAADFAPDFMHLSVSGHRKQAELEWKVLGYS